MKRPTLLLRKLACLFALTLLVALSALLVYALVYIFQSEISPAIAQGTFSVSTQTMILNRVWVGNEIYLLIAIYVGLVVAMLAGVYVLLERVFSVRRGDS